MKFVILLLAFSGQVLWATPKTDAFIIQILDRKISVLSPETERKLFSVIVENRSLSDQVARFETKGRLLKYLSIPSGKSESLELENTAGSPVVFVPVNPSFQEVELIFGKKAYEVPSQK